MSAAHHNLSIRLAAIDDLPRIVEIYNQSIAGKQATADLQPVSVADRQAWFDAHTGNRPLVVAQTRSETSSQTSLDEIIGWGSLSDLYARPAYHISTEISIYVAEEAKGQGVGKALVNYLIEVAPSCGVQQVVALIFAHNTPSLAMFDRLGFEPWGEFKQVCDMKGFIADVVILGKSVD
ncbi:GNAT family N-acetyltransferase [Moraxella osloensis]|uniref:GNAT family N-acetyltransferase n=1 Tax=Faucicola osloensis TaxID=34062 RepID=A0A6P1KNV2_FAUOS|nr:GNAT family N-acetyltransferase [Moraxella osloensis]QHG09904.1 GNAT family N-acetyltransferase [Moraxella osloensis]